MDRSKGYAEEKKAVIQGGGGKENQKLISLLRGHGEVTAWKNVSISTVRGKKEWEPLKSSPCAKDLSAGKKGGVLKEKGGEKRAYFEVDRTNSAGNRGIKGRGAERGGMNTSSGAGRRLLLHR